MARASTEHYDSLHTSRFKPGDKVRWFQGGKSGIPASSNMLEGTVVDVVPAGRSMHEALAFHGLKPASHTVDVGRRGTRLIIATRTSDRRNFATVLEASAHRVREA